MYKYPTSIADAAAVLDFAYKDWFIKINLSILDMELSDKCILGQLFGNGQSGFEKGLKELFGIIIYDKHYMDDIFGYRSNVEHWKQEIRRRKHYSEAFFEYVVI